MFLVGLSDATGRPPYVAELSVDERINVKAEALPAETSDVAKGRPDGPDGFLFYGDNLQILRDYLPEDEVVDLVYLDPPFKSDQSYNVLFRERDGTQAAAQLRAFGDTWRWDKGAEAAYQEVVERGGDVSRALQAFRTFLKTSDMMAYLAMMAPRLIELHRVLKPTGSLYLHCDPTASHYLKMLLDAIFGPQHFRNEIVWKRSDAHNDAKQGAKHFGRLHDVLLFFSKTDAPKFHQLYRPLPESTVSKWYRHIEEGSGRRYNKADVTGPGGAAKGNPHFEWNGITRYWRYNREKMQRLHDAGRLVYTKSGMAYEKRYLDESKGVAIQDWWDDIAMLRGIHRGGERLGYPTQKPTALLERIIKASTDEGDVVLDPFCGCGTTIDAAHQLKRRWIGIDITYAAISVIRNRFKSRYAIELSNVTGAPVTAQDAAQLAESNPYQFQWWALDLVAARPTEQKKGADKGIDGRLYCHEFEGGPTKQVIFSVKAGTHIMPAHVSELRGVVDREKAAIGVLITMHPPTKAMKVEAATAGFYQSPWGRHPRLQILTVEQLLSGEGVDYPPARQASVTYKPVPLAKGSAQQLGLFDTGRRTPMAKAPLFETQKAAKRKRRA